MLSKFALAVDDVEVAVDKPDSLVGLKERDHFREEVRVIKVIVRCPRQIAAAGGVVAGIQPTGQSLVGLVADGADAGIAGAVLCDDLWRAVHGAVVDDDQLPVWIRLGEDAFDRQSQYLSRHCRRAKRWTRGAGLTWVNLCLFDT